MIVKHCYATIVNEETYEVQLGVGCTDEYYEEIGMTKMDVEQGYDYKWYVFGHAPAKPDPTVDEKKEDVRTTRDHYISDIEWRVSRYEDQVKLYMPTTDSQAEYYNILHYMQYLRDYPESSQTWYEQDPMTYEVWKRQN